MSIIQLFEVIQVALAVYVLYYCVVVRIDWGIISLYTVTVVLFAGLKFNIISFPEGSVENAFLWATYNVLYSLFVLFTLIDIKNARDNNNTSGTS